MFMLLAWLSLAVFSVLARWPSVFDQQQGIDHRLAKEPVNVVPALSVTMDNDDVVRCALYCDCDYS